MLNPYQEILTRPGALAFSASGLVARLPMAMVGIGIVFMVEATYDSYALAGRLTGTYVLVYALCAPQLGRLVDRYGQARVMRPAVVVAAASLAAFTWLATVQAPTPALYVTAAVSGATTGSIGAMVRSRWTHLLGGGRDLHTAYALESTLDEVVFVVGPVVITLLATSVSPTVGLAVPTVALIAGGLVFLAQRSTEPPLVVRDPSVRHRFVLLHRGMPVIVLVSVALGTIFGATDVAVVAFTEAQGRPSAAGFVLAVFALGSLLSGLIYGARQWVMSLWRRFAIGAGALAAGTSLFVLVDGVVALGVVMFVAGFAIAPTLITANALTQRLVPPVQLTEGLTWMSTSLAAGVAAGAAVAGQVTDTSGPRAGFGVVVAGGLVAVLVVGAAALAAVVRRRRAYPTEVPNSTPRP